MKDPAKTPSYPAALRDHWHGIALTTVLRHAALLNLLPWGTTKLTALPRDAYRIAAAAIIAERDRACAMEIDLGRRPARIEQDLNTNLWNALQPWNRTAAPSVDQKPPAQHHLLGDDDAEIT